MKQKRVKWPLLCLLMGLGFYFLLFMIDCKSSPEAPAAPTTPTVQTTCLHFTMWRCEGPAGEELAIVKAGEKYTFHRILANSGTTTCTAISICHKWSENDSVGLGSGDMDDKLLNQTIYNSYLYPNTSYESYIDLTIPNSAISGQTYWMGVYIAGSSCANNTCDYTAVWKLTIE
jgi:hypothetical protein